MTDTYRAEKDEKIPLRWSAPEVIKEGLSSSASDIWSLGILFWEVFSHGAKPFADLNKKEAGHMISECKTVPGRPKNCPREVYDLMESCWCYDPDERPDAGEVQEALAGCVKSGAGEGFVSPVNRDVAVRQAMSTCDVRMSYHDEGGLSHGEQEVPSNITRAQPGRKGFMSRFNKKKGHPK